MSYTKVKLKYISNKEENINYSYSRNGSINLDFRFFDLNPTKQHVYTNIQIDGFLNILKLFKQLCINYEEFSEEVDFINVTEPKEIINNIIKDVNFEYGYGNGEDLYSYFKKEDTTFSIYNLFKLRDGGDWNYLNKSLTVEEKINKEVIIDVNLHQITEKDVDKLIKILEKNKGDENYFFYNKRDNKHYTLKEIFN